MPTLPSHDSDCQRCVLVQANLDIGRVYPIVSRKNRYDCPGCLVKRFGDSVKHLPLLHATLTTKFDPAHKTLRKHASRLSAGYMRLSLRGYPCPLVVASPNLYPGEQAGPVLGVLKYAMDVSLQYQLSRLSFNTLWKPPSPEPMAYAELVLPPGVSYADAVSALRQYGVNSDRLGNLDWDWLKGRLMDKFAPTASGWANPPKPV